MATNTIRPGQTGPPRANTVRPRPALEVVPTNVPAPEAAPPVAAPAEAVAPAPVPASVPASVPAAPAPAAVVPPVAPRPPRVPRPAPKPLTEEEARAQAEAWKEAPTGATATGWSLFSLLDRFTGLDGLFREGLPVRYLPKLLFVMALTLLYIGNTHYGNRMNRNIQRLKQEVEDLRADYTTLKSDYMEASKQSEVARKVAALGLVESSSPPFRIAVPAGHLDEAELEAMPVLTADTLAARAARDSVAQVRADSIEGRVRRQQLGLPTTDEADEAGAPPPGVSPEDSVAARNPQAASQIDSDNPRAATRQSRANGTKKHKKAQGVQAPSNNTGKAARSHSPSHGRSTR